MNRRVISVLILLCLCLAALAGCGKSADESSIPAAQPTTSADSRETITATFSRGAVLYEDEYISVSFSTLVPLDEDYLGTGETFFEVDFIVQNKSSEPIAISADDILFNSTPIDFPHGSAMKGNEQGELRIFYRGFTLDDGAEEVTSISFRLRATNDVTFKDDGNYSGSYTDKSTLFTQQFTVDFDEAILPDNATSADDIDIGSEPDPLTVVTHTEEYTLKRCNDYSLESHRFYGDVAWATLQNTSTSVKRKGLINQAGDVIYLLDHEKMGKSSVDRLITTPFINGLSCVYSYQSGNAAYSTPGFIIVDSQGKEVYSCFDDTVYMCGQADDGSYILIRHESGFSSDNWYFSILDSELNLVDTDIETSDTIRSQSVSIWAITDGVYLLEDGYSRYFLNLNTNSLFSASYMGKNDDSIFVGTGRDIYIVPISYIADISSAEELITLIDSNGFPKTIAGLNSPDYTYSDWNNGSFYYEYEEKGVREYRDLSGNTLVTLPEIPEEASYFREENFSGGYAALLLVGADGKGYVTIIDETGTMQYDPVPCRGFPSLPSSVEVTSCNGYVFAKVLSPNSLEFEIIDPQGQYKEIGEDLSGLAGAVHSFSDFSFAVTIGGDFIYWASGALQGGGRATLASVDGEVIIDTAIANFNEFGEIIPPGTETYINQDSQEVSGEIAEQKDYITLSNFSIEGKWKNVGTYTFGQVQSGAIVAFDGTNCNFFSPKDTYAFYKDDDHYKLECTSLLATDTLSFTVKIVDENNIDVFNGSNILELTRVE